LSTKLVTTDTPNLSFSCVSHNREMSSEAMLTFSYDLAPAAHSSVFNRLGGRWPSSAATTFSAAIMHILRRVATEALGLIEADIAPGLRRPLSPTLFVSRANGG
jgi:hypothetical protein